MWRPTLGAVPSIDGTSFCLWAPAARRVDLLVDLPDGSRREVEMRRDAEGFFTALLPDVAAGALYQYRPDGQGPFPDPVSRFLPQGVHGRSEVVDPSAFWWTDGGWTGIAAEEAIIYELHVGTFSSSGKFAGIIQRLPYLKDLGVTAIELMPVAEFPGQRNWGYDGASLFAPSRAYGRPDDLRRLVDEAHGLGLAVLLDVVYNHLGPDGNYLGVYSPHYFTERHHTPWGAAVDYDGEHRRPVRDFFIENALYWIHEYHFDGLRLDATHSIYDDSRPHILDELTERVKTSVTTRQVLVIAEDHRNLAHMIRPKEAGGWGLDGVWADDFHHQARRLLAGDREGYFQDFAGTTADLAQTLRQGWLFTGQYSKHLGEPRGTDPAGIPPNRFVICLQNHDQIGNRALGERLHHEIDLAAWRAASALLLVAPHTPLLFMGQEWAASTPFLFFTDHHGELAGKVTAGRREEFKYFAAFRNQAAREEIPDPQAGSTFLLSKLVWDEQQRQPHESVLRLYRELLWLRRTEPALVASEESTFDVTALSEDALLLVRTRPGASAIATVVQLRGSGSLTIPPLRGGESLAEVASTSPETHSPPKTSDPLAMPAASWQVLLTTEDPSFAPDPQPPRCDLATSAARLTFHRPGAVLLKHS